MSNLIDFLAYTVSHSDDECLNWLKEAKLQQFYTSSSLFCCIVNGRFNSFHYLLEQTQSVDDTICDHTYDSTISTLSAISMKQRKEFVSTAADKHFITKLFGLREWYMNKDLATTSVACHYVQVVKNSALKMLSHCFIDCLLFDCSTYKSCICLTKPDATIPSWYAHYNNWAHGRFFMQSYFISNFIKTDIEIDNWFDNCMNYEFEKDCNDENLFKHIIQQMENGIKMYKKLLDKYPSIQFVTTFCRELPHLYAKSLLNQTYIKPLIEKKDKNKQLQSHENVEPKLKEYQFTNNCKKLFGELFDKYSHSSKVDNCNFWSKGSCVDDSNYRVMNVQEARKFMYSCGAPSKSSWSPEETKRSFAQYNKNNSSELLSKDGFINFFLEASFRTPTCVIDDIVMQGMGQRLIDLDRLNCSINCQNPNNFDKLLQLRHSFVEYLEKKFIFHEKLLLISMTKKASIFKNRFDKMNDDVLSLILKYFHPLNLNETHSVISDIDGIIRNHFKYELGMGCTLSIYEREYKLLNQVDFAQIARRYLMRKLQRNEQSDLSSLALVMQQKNQSNLIDFHKLICQHFKSCAK